MIDEFVFVSNSLLIPPEDQIDPEDFKMFFVEKGDTHKTKYIFDEVFEGEFNHLRVIPLPDFNATDMKLLDDAITKYEANPELFEESMYEIASVYH